ncbi:MAG TPA: spore germination protein [Symbiobacteriaceae bacterium]|nr:spore germination protein [Symbiobacteriaceae bacterium]
MSTKKAPSGKLEAYLQRAGLWVEAAMADRAASNPAELQKLGAALHGHKAKLPISPDTEEMKQLVMALFGSAMDLIVREHQLDPGATPALSVCFRGPTDQDMLERALAELQNCMDAAPADPEQFLDWLARRRSSVPETLIESRLDRLTQAMLDGHTIMFVEGAARALNLDTSGWPHRKVEEPLTEGVVRGPREGFTELLTVNTALLRRRIRDERLRIDLMRIGEVTGTRVAVAYVAGLCRPALVAEAKRRLGRIKIDGVLESMYLEEFIEDTPWTVFPLLKSTERPDVAASALLEGRVVIFTEGTPFALIAPTSFTDMMQTPEDYYERFPIIILVRVLRWFFAAIALLGPAFYVAFTTFHHEMLPHQLLLSIMAAREGVPFPAVVEALIMEISFEALREAGIRMPKQIGQAISIVGALVIGQAAVQAGIVSAPMVIVVSLTGLASFVIPKYSTAIALRILRFIMLLLAGTFGAFGLIMGVMCVLIHLASLRSFGAPYYAPLAPLLPDDFDDAIIRVPHWSNRSRPTETDALDPIRAASGLSPAENLPQGKEHEQP